MSQVKITLSVIWYCDIPPFIIRIFKETYIQGLTSYPRQDSVHRKVIPCPVPGPGVWKAIPIQFRQVDPC